MRLLAATFYIFNFESIKIMTVFIDKDKVTEYFCMTDECCTFFDAKRPTKIGFCS